MTEKLKPCPFCGYEVGIDSPVPRDWDNFGPQGYCVRCGRCDLLFGYDEDLGGVFKTPEEAAEAWNRRTVNDGQESQH